MNPETYLRHKIHLMIRTEFPDTFIFHPSFILVSGIPDFLICYRGYFIGIEVKTPKGHLSRLQQYILDKIKKAGGSSFVVRSVDEARKCLTSINRSL